jgi:hypothetical protein
MDDILQVSELENDIVSRPFTMEEVREVVFLMEHNKAPGPDGILADFF